jgi:hypothetical protein
MTEKRNGLRPKQGVKNHLRHRVAYIKADRLRSPDFDIVLGRAAQPEDAVRANARALAPRNLRLSAQRGIIY